MGKGIRSFFSISTLEDGTPSDISKGYHVETCRRFADVVELASLLSIVAPLRGLPVKTAVSANLADMQNGSYILISAFWRNSVLAKCAVTYCIKHFTVRTTNLNVLTLIFELGESKTTIVFCPLGHHCLLDSRSISCSCNELLTFAIKGQKSIINSCVPSEVKWSEVK